MAITPEAAEAISGFISMQDGVGLAGRFRKQWKKKWFHLSVAEDLFLEYNETKESKVLGRLRVKDISELDLEKDSDQNAEKSRFYLICDGKRYSLAGESSGEADQWVAQLKLLKELVLMAEGGPNQPEVQVSTPKTTVVNPPSVAQVDEIAVGSSNNDNAMSASTAPLEEVLSPNTLSAASNILAEPSPAATTSCVDEEGSLQAVISPPALSDLAMTSSMLCDPSRTGQGEADTPERETQSLTSSQILDMAQVTPSSSLPSTPARDPTMPESQVHRQLDLSSSAFPPPSPGILQPGSGVQPLDASEIQVKKLTIEVHALQEQLTSSRGDLASMHSQVAGLSREVAKHRDRAIAAEDKVVELSGELRVAQEKSALLEEREAEVARLEQERDQLRAEQASQGENAESAARMTNEIKALKSRLEDVLREVLEEKDRAEAEMSQRIAVEEAFRLMKEDMQGQDARVTGVEAERDIALERVGELEDIVVSLKQDMEEMSKHGNSAVAQLAQESSDLKDQVAFLTKHKEEVEGRIQASHHERKEMEAKASIAEQQVAALEQTVSVAADELTISKRQLEAAEHQLAETRAAMKSASGQMASETMKVSNLNAELAASQAEQARLAAALESGSQSFKALKSQMKEHAANTAREVEALREEVQDSKQREEDAVTDVQMMTKEVENALARAASKAALVEKAEKAREAAEEMRVMSERRNTALRTQNDELLSRMEQMAEELDDALNSGGCFSCFKVFRKKSQRKSRASADQEGPDSPLLPGQGYSLDEFAGPGSGPYDM